MKYEQSQSLLGQLTQFTSETKLKRLAYLQSVISKSINYVLGINFRNRNNWKSYGIEDY